MRSSQSQVLIDHPPLQVYPVVCVSSNPGLHLNQLGSFCLFDVRISPCKLCRTTRCCLSIFAAAPRCLLSTPHCVLYGTLYPVDHPFRSNQFPRPLLQQFVYISCCCCVDTEARPVCVCPTGCPSSCTTLYQGRRRCALELSLVVSSLVPHAFTLDQAVAPIAFFPRLPQSLDVAEVCMCQRGTRIIMVQGAVQAMQ